ncbi:hypothetical protein JG687_00007588 [Phytophthora cactorum]|uniref:Uncharacterized protein n=2 Tax=Phytophthora cactorum TaxID=29920 RepID=A0A8T1UJA3_9STRA|nr:hypothetical protein JG687_00007588 [Phytophthora cactorum]
MKQDPALQLRGFLLDIVGLCALTLVLESSLLGVSDVADGDSLSVNFGIAWHEDDETANDLPAWVESEDDIEVLIADRLHLSLLHEAYNDYELINDSNLSERLRCCPGVDIFQPFGLRGNGYCEDAVAYAKCTSVLGTKFYDETLGREVDYYDLCLKTPMIFFNHYWDGVPESPRWLKDKPLYLMPNIEMIELTLSHYWRVGVVLCKTHVCNDSVTRRHEENGNPRNTNVFITKHTSSDQAEFARQRLGNDSIAPKDFFQR